MSQPVEVEGKLLVKNTALNLIGQVIPLLVALVTIPYIIRGLGAERFGIFSLAFVVLGYFSIFDFGLGRATTKFVAEALGKGEANKVPTIIWTSLAFVTIFSIIGVLILVALTPLLVERALNIPNHLIEEAKAVFYIMSISILITLITATLSGALEAYQRFDLVNALRVPSNILSFILPAIALFFRASLPVIVLLLVVKNVCILFFYLLYCLKVTPLARHSFYMDFEVVPSLFSFGGWIALHNAAVAILSYLDRFLVGVFLTMSAVTYYTAPYELANRTLIIPSSIMMVLFPAFSALGALDKEKLRELFHRALKYLTLIMGLIIGVIFVFAREILLLWLGKEFAAKSTMVLQIFSIGVFLSSLAWLSGTVLQGIGKPRSVTIINLLQIPTYIMLTWLLIISMDIKGAAIAWAVQKGLIAIFLYKVCWKLGLFRSVWIIEHRLLKFMATILTMSAALLIVKSSFHFSLSITVAMFLGAVISYLIAAWYYIDSGDKRVLLNTSQSVIKFLVSANRNRRNT